MNRSSLFGKNSWFGNCWFLEKKQKSIFEMISFIEFFKIIARDLKSREKIVISKYCCKSILKSMGLKAENLVKIIIVFQWQGNFLLN